MGRLMRSQLPNEKRLMSLNPLLSVLLLSMILYDMEYLFDSFGSSAWLCGSQAFAHPQWADCGGTGESRQGLDAVQSLFSNKIIE